MHWYIVMVLYFNTFFFLGIILLSNSFSICAIRDCKVSVKCKLVNKFY